MYQSWIYVLFALIWKNQHNFKTVNVVARIFDRFVGQVCLEISRCCSESILMNVSDIIIADLHAGREAPRVGGAPQLSKSTHSKKFGDHVTVHRRLADRPYAPQGNQCLLSHFLASLGAQEKTNCTSMLRSIDSCENRVSADQYHLTVPRAQVQTHRGRAQFMRQVYARLQDLSQ